MNSVERVMELCKKKGIPVSKVEKDLGFANGYIARLKKGFPADRLKKIADYLGVSENYLLTGDEDAETETGYYLSVETAQIAQEIFENKDLRVLFDAGRGASPESLRLASEILIAMNKGSDSDDT